jgi:hypothetical protein
MNDGVILYVASVGYDHLSGSRLWSQLLIQFIFFECIRQNKQIQSVVLGNISNGRELR